MLYLNGNCYDETHGMREVMPGHTSSKPAKPYHGVTQFQMDIGQRMVELGLPTNHLARPAVKPDVAARHRILTEAGVEL